jgi:hypothetical protein
LLAVLLGDGGMGRDKGDKGDKVDKEEHLRMYGRGLLCPHERSTVGKPLLITGQESGVTEKSPHTPSHRASKNQSFLFGNFYFKYKLI